MSLLPGHTLEQSLELMRARTLDTSSLPECMWKFDAAQRASELMYSIHLGAVITQLAQQNEPDYRALYGWAPRPRDASPALAPQ
jgi:hypothetical protein